LARGVDTIKATQAQARARVLANPGYASSLITDLNSGKRKAIDPIDQTVLAQKRYELQTARDKAGEVARNTKLSPGERGEAATNFEDLDRQIHDLDRAAAEGMRLQGEQAKLYHSYKVKDYTPDNMETKLYIAKKGQPLTVQEQAAIKKNTDKFAADMTAIAQRKRAIGWQPGAPSDKALRDLQFDADQAKNAMDEMIFKANHRNLPPLERFWKTGREILAIPRAIMASTDLSAVRRQGGLIFMAHPILAMKAMPDMLRAARSDRAYFDLMQDIRERPNAPLYASSKLGLTDVRAPKLSQLEEQYMSRWADMIPIVSHSQRAYVYYLNRLRADTFDMMAKTLSRKGAVTPEQANVLSHFINVFTGRGMLPDQAAGAIAAVNNAFFAPRYVLSRFQALTGAPLRYSLRQAGLRDPVTKAIAGEYARTLIGYGLTIGLINAAASPYASVSLDPTSTDFGKVKIGNTRVDILSGIGQTIVLLGRLGYGKSTSPTGEVKYLHGPLHRLTDPTIGSVLAQFGRSKLAPIPATIWNATEGERVTTQPTDLTQEITGFTKRTGEWEYPGGGLFTPLVIGDIYAALKEHDVPTATAVSLLAILGDNVNTYAPRASGGGPQMRAHLSR